MIDVLRERTSGGDRLNSPKSRCAIGKPMAVRPHGTALGQSDGGNVAMDPR